MSQRRKWFGVVLLLIEMNLLGGTIFGFPALFQILAKEKIYADSSQQIKHYQNAMTLGIAFFDLPAFFIGFFIDKFGCRTVKLVSIIFHIVGWLSLSLLNSKRSYLLYIHCVFSSLSGITVLLTTYTSSNYFAKNRAFVSSLFAGAGLSATMWFSIFQILIDNNRLTLSQLSYIWLSFGFVMFVSSFVCLDWNFQWLNLPYQFDIELESNEENRKSFLKTALNPLYVLVVLFLSILLLPTICLSVYWNPYVRYLTNANEQLLNRYTFAYNLSSISALLICPLNGYLLGYHADRSQQRKLLNICLVESVSWLLNIVLCIHCMFLSSNLLIPILILNILSRSTIVAGCQSVISTFFPSIYIGRLSGIMWTIVGAITFVQLGLTKLTEDIHKAWRAWVIVLSLCVVMSIHLFQIWIRFIRQRKKDSKHFFPTVDRF